MRLTLGIPYLTISRTRPFDDRWLGIVRVNQNREPPLDWKVNVHFQRSGLMRVQEAEHEWKITDIVPR